LSITDEDLDDLDDILRYIASNFPPAYRGFEARFQAVELRIGQWPLSARRVANRSGVRIVPLTRYPYNIFYRVAADSVEILHIRHSARQDR
jgi:toxin ParE1/3/4